MYSSYCFEVSVSFYYKMLSMKYGVTLPVSFSALSWSWLSWSERSLLTTVKAFFSMLSLLLCTSPSLSMMYYKLRFSTCKSATVSLFVLTSASSTAISFLNICFCVLAWEIISSYSVVYWSNCFMISLLFSSSFWSFFSLSYWVFNSFKLW